MAKPKDPNEKTKAAGKKIEIETEDRDGQKQTAGGQAQADKKTNPADGKKTQGKPAAEESAAPEPTAEELLKAEKDKYLRLAAEYDNFRKRTAKERESIYSNAKADVIGKLLPVYDNVERAIKMECADEAYYKGIEMIMTQLTEILKNLGVQPIEAAGEPFDPNRHNAILRIEDPNLGEGIVAEECKKGFTLGERIIRFSDVVVAN